MHLGSGFCSCWDALSLNITNRPPPLHFWYGYFLGAEPVVRLRKITIARTGEGLTWSNCWAPLPHIVSTWSTCVGSTFGASCPPMCHRPHRRCRAATCPRSTAARWRAVAIRRPPIRNWWFMWAVCRIARSTCSSSIQVVNKSSLSKNWAIKTELRVQNDLFRIQQQIFFIVPNPTLLFKNLWKL